MLGCNHQGEVKVPRIPEWPKNFLGETTEVQPFPGIGGIGMRASMRLRRLLSTVAVTFGVLLSAISASPAPFQPGNIFIAYGGNRIGVFADTVSLSGSQVDTLILLGL